MGRRPLELLSQLRLSRRGVHTSVEHSSHKRHFNEQNMPPVSSDYYAYGDRLKPRICQQRGRNLNDVVPRQPRNSPSTSSASSRVGAVSPQQRRAREIVRKYRRSVQHRELRRLKAVVPNVAHRQQATQDEILNETVRYIDQLHQQLAERIQAQGIPDRLKELAPEFIEKRTGLASGAQDDAPVTRSDVRSLLEVALGPQLERSLQAKHVEDKDRLQQLIEADQRMRPEM